MKDKMYCVYVAFDGKVPWNDDEQFNYVCPMEQVFYTTTETPVNVKRARTFVSLYLHPMKNSYLIQGATFHVTPNKHLLFSTSICCREIKVAYGRHVQARQVGDILLKSECGNYLYLQGVLYPPMFNKNIISAPQLMQSQDYTNIMKNDYVQMQYKGTGLKMQLTTTENLYIFIGR
jgi:hypothetical protein